MIKPKQFFYVNSSKRKFKYQIIISLNFISIFLIIFLVSQYQSKSNKYLIKGLVHDFIFEGQQGNRFSEFSQYQQSLQKLISNYQEMDVLFAQEISFDQVSKNLSYLTKE